MATAASTIDSRAYIEQAVALIEDGDHDLARTYLAPALIDHRLSAGERSRAYYLRGYSFFAEGLFVSARKDYVRALEFNAENPAALAALAGLHYRGQGTPANRDLAIELFTQAADRGHDDAQVALGFLYLEGTEDERDVEKARRLLEEPAEAGRAAAMIALGRSYRAPFADPPEPEVAREWFERAAAAGEAEALATLAYMYRDGELGEADQPRALELFEEAAAAGSTNAMASLGYFYMVGDGVEADPARAQALLEEAADAGNAAAGVRLGYLFEAGLGVPVDIEQAKRWYRVGADAGLADAQLRLFYIHLAEGDDAAAATWIAKAAEQELPQAHNDYAWLLSTSRRDDLRDGERALAFAERAVAKDRNAAYLDTLAAAYAELGRFEDAISTQKLALELTDDASPEESAALTQHLRAYQAGEPWRE